MNSRGAQLALRFPLSSRARFDSFVVGANTELMRKLDAVAGEQAFAGCMLYGVAGVGRTHLLQAACHHHDAADGRGAIYLPLADPALAPRALDGLDALSLVAVDDIDAWLGRSEPELALLALYNGLQQAGGRLLVSASAPPARLAFRYPDLASRLRGLPAYEVVGLDDADKARVLSRRAGERGLALAPSVLAFWLSRGARDLPSLLDGLERVDAAAMAEQRRVTVRLLKQVLGL